ncbi:AAA family ATPase [Bacillus mycoides]|uniref:AAA family ATPase n=1 Tax=Bacillus mycoides TaxID=1405 RepID=UPI001C01C9B3|nr:AAA family ATPase [Bacillus mycoides]QWG87380.1 ATP-binding protein [Bacillus mycoides]
MLVNFRFGNYLSYHDMAEFSMVVGNAKKHSEHVMKFEDISLLKFAAIYGANAAGKSNLVKAIKFSRNLVIRGFRNMVTSDKYCRIYPSNEEELTNFEYEIAIDGTVYSYGFSVNLFEKTVYREWLYSLSNNQEIEIFTRELKDNRYRININYNFLGLSQKEQDRLDVYKEDSKELTESLFITELNKNKKPFLGKNDFSIFNLIYEWFERKLVVISPDKSPADNGISNMREDNGISLANFLYSFGTGIKEVCTKEVYEKDLYNEMPSRIAKKILEDIRKDAPDSIPIMLRTPQNIYEIEKQEEHLKIQAVYFKHLSESGFYSLGEESDGTVRLVELYDILANDNEKVFVIDEIDRSLHPNLTYKFIEAYLTKNNNGQLIATTHEDRLLDLNMLRRDEIWFVEKQEKGESALYSLEKFKTRFDQNILKAYLEGRYGSIPQFKLFQNVESREQ